MNHRKVPDELAMRLYVQRGLTQIQIVEAWEKDSSIRVSRSAIAMALSRYGLRTSHKRGCTSRYTHACRCARA